MTTFLYLLIIAAAGFVVTKYVIIPTVKKNANVEPADESFTEVEDPAVLEETCPDMGESCENGNPEVETETPEEQNVGEYPIGVFIPEDPCEQCEDPCEQCDKTECENNPEFCAETGYDESINYDHTQEETESAVEAPDDNTPVVVVPVEEEVAPEVESEKEPYVAPEVEFAGMDENPEEPAEFVNDEVANEEPENDPNDAEPMTEEDINSIIDNVGETDKPQAEDDGETSYEDEVETERESESEHSKESEEEESPSDEPYYGAYTEVKVRVKFTDIRVSIDKSLPFDISILYNGVLSQDNLLTIKAGKTGTTINKRQKDEGNYIESLVMQPFYYDNVNNVKYIFTQVDKF